MSLCSLQPDISFSRLALAVRQLAGIRRARLGAVCALALTCACLPLANGQDSSGDSAKKPATAKPTTTHSSTTHKSTTKKSRRKKSTRVRGQQKIDSERATAIQQALIREHYLTGEATGKWNEASEEAMRRYQADHGWQSKVVPDSRALIKLGLGPSKDHLLNPESAMATSPDAPRPASTTPATSADPASTPATHPPDNPSPQ